MKHEAAGKCVGFALKQALRVQRKGRSSLHAGVTQFKSDLQVVTTHEGGEIN